MDVNKTGGLNHTKQKDNKMMHNTRHIKNNKEIGKSVMKWGTKFFLSSSTTT